MAATLTKASVITSSAGMKMPVIGLGTLTRSSEEKISDDEVGRVIDMAIEAGYRHIDTAYMYNNEAAIGKALKRWLDSGKIKREELFIVTKLPMVAMNKDLVEEYLLRSLKSLQLDYLDLFLLHKPVGFQPGEVLFPLDQNGYLKLDMNTDHVAIWKAMEAQVDAGRTKFIGVSDFNIRQMDRLMKIARIPPSTNQVECHLYFQQKELREWGEKHGVPVTAYACLGSPAAVSVFNGPKNMTESQLKSPMTEDDVVHIAKVHKKTVGQILLRHLLQLGVAVIPKSSNPERLKQNLDIFDFQLSTTEMAKLNALDQGEEGRKFFVSNLGKGYDTHPECPYPKCPEHRN